MALPCPDDCPEGVPYLDWLSFSQLYQEYLTYCALATAAGNYPGPGPFQPLGVYTHTTDSSFVVPADASLVYWDAPGQTGNASLDFSLVQAGQEVTIVVIDSNGFNVTDDANTVFSLNDTSHRIQGIKSNGDGTITRITGTAAQYDVGSGSGAIPLNQDVVHIAGPETITGKKTFSDAPIITGGFPLDLVPSGSQPPYVHVSVNGGAGQLEFGVSPANGTFFSTDLANEGAVKMFMGPAINIGLVDTICVKIKTSGVSILGTNTNDSASSGRIGEVVSSTVASGSAVALTTGTPADVTSISLTAGDWDISGSVYFLQDVTTTATYYTGGIGPTTATLPGYAGAQGSIPGTAGAITGYDPTVALPPTRVSLAATTTYFLVAQSGFLVSTNAAYGHLRARRVR